MDAGRLDDEAMRVSVGLRLGLPICKPHTCVCEAMVDERSLHGLSCMRGIGRLSRHNHINDIMCRAFASAGMPTVKGSFTDWSYPRDRTSPGRPDVDTMVLGQMSYVGCHRDRHSCPEQPQFFDACSRI